jgi:hypothetical protein
MNERPLIGDRGLKADWRLTTQSGHSNLQTPSLNTLRRDERTTGFGLRTKTVE